MIQVDQLSIQQGSISLSKLSFHIHTGVYGILMGQTGCGKTTILEAICGLRSIRSGRIILAGRDVTDLKPSERGIGFVPQDGAIFPTMNVRDQIGFGLTVRKRPKAEIRRKVDELADTLGIRGILDRRPQGLSGGERQRIALGRALAIEPQVLCLDEPLSALDDETRREMYVLLKQVQQQTKVTALHITHSQDEAQTLADELLLLDGGVIRQIAREEPTESGAEPSHPSEEQSAPAEAV